MSIRSNDFRPSPYKLKPKSRTEYLYTKGNQLSLDGQNYVGEYHISGKLAYTGPVHSVNSKRLRKIYTNPDLYQYDKARNFIERVRSEPNQIVWSPIETEYVTGFATRYFVERMGRMEGYPIEIDQQQADNYGANRGIDEGIYILVRLKWKLTGSLRNIYRNGQLHSEGIYEYNLREVRSKGREIPNLEFGIKSFTEYARVTLSPKL